MQELLIDLQSESNVQIKKKIFLSNEVGISTHTGTDLTCGQSTWNI